MTAASTRPIRGANMMKVIEYINNNVGQTLSVAQISAATGLPPRTVRRVIRILASNGLVKRQPGRTVTIIATSSITAVPKKARPEKVSRAGEAIVEEAIRELAEEEEEEEEVLEEEGEEEIEV